MFLPMRFIGLTPDSQAGDHSERLFVRGNPKITSHVQGGRDRRSVTLCDKGGGILNFVTSHFKNSIKAILHV